MSKRTIVGLVILAAVLILTPYYYKLITPKSQAIPSLNTEKQTPDTTIRKKQTATMAQGKPGWKDSLSLGVAQFDSSLYDSIPVRDIVVRTPRMRIVLTTQGGDIREVEIPDYKVPSGDVVQLVPQDITGTVLDVELFRGQHTLSLSGVRFTTDRDSLVLKKGDQSAAVTFMGRLPDGTVIQRRYEFDSDGFHIRHHLVVDFPDSVHPFDGGVLWWRRGLLPTEKNISQDVANFAAYFRMGGTVERKHFKKGKAIDFSSDGETEYVASVSKYFCAILSPYEGVDDGVRISGIWRDFTAYGKTHSVPVIGVGLYRKLLKSTFAQDDLIVLAPRDYFFLKNYGRGFQGVVNLGWKWLYPLSVGILWFFRLLYGLIANYGVVILIFTLLMKIVLTPLSHSQLKSMEHMKQLQPKLKELQERYRDNSQKLQQETMKLYKKYGVNPLGGCLPLLVQMPIFIALYRVLALGFQFRAKPFVFWIHDLSAMDPYYVLPILMVVVMFIQQKMTITDPKQKMMAYMMPALFFFFFYKMPAGLVLYWTFFNILSFLHQLWIMRRTPSIISGNAEPSSS